MQVGLFTLALRLARRLWSLIWNILINFISFEGGIAQEIILLVGIWIIVPIVTFIVEKFYNIFLKLLKHWE